MEKVCTIYAIVKLINYNKAMLIFMLTLLLTNAFVKK